MPDYYKDSDGDFRTGDWADGYRKVVPSGAEERERVRQASHEILRTMHLDPATATEEDLDAAINLAMENLPPRNA